MPPRNFLATDDWSDDEILALLLSAARCKTLRQSDELRGRVLGMIFFDPSLRTRASFEVAMLRHGGHALTIEPGRGVWAFETRHGVRMDGGAAEHIAEAAPVLGRYADALGVRAFPKGATWAEAREDATIHAFARYAGVPVINFESARRHPCQGLADALTLQEKLREPAGKRFVLTWCWHPKPLPTAVPVSAAIAAARLGMEVVIARPPGFDLDPSDMSTIETIAARNGGRVAVTDDQSAAVAGADAVYAKSWGSLAHFGDEAAEAEVRRPHQAWCIDEAKMRTTRGGRGVFMHCLPIRRNVIATDGVLDGPWSAVVDQAENRLHAQRALLLALLGESR